MSSQSPRASRTEAPQESCDAALQDAVAGLLHLSLEERNYIKSYSIESCEEKLRELISHLSDPAGKLQHTILDVFGQMALVYQHKAELQAIEDQGWLAQLKHDNSCLRIHKKILH